MASKANTWGIFMFLNMQIVLFGGLKENYYFVNTPFVALVPNDCVRNIAY